MTTLRFTLSQTAQDNLAAILRQLDPSRRLAYDGDDLVDVGDRATFLDVILIAHRLDSALVTAELVRLARAVLDLRTFTVNVRLSVDQLRAVRENEQGAERTAALVAFRSAANEIWLPDEPAGVDK